MIKGMTGFGSAPFSNGRIKGTVEIKSLNHRFFDVSFYLPPGFGSLEGKIRQTVAKNIRRGKVNVAVRITHTPPATIEFNKEAIRNYLKQAKALRREFDIRKDLSLSDLTKMPGVVDVKETEIKPQVIWPGIEKSMKAALKSLMAMRVREARALIADLKDKLNRMKQRVKKIKARAKVILSVQKKKLSEEEFLSFQRSNDINEELTRLDHYIDEIKILLGQNVPVGKKMDFIAQEMQRETNTIGSKLQDKVVSNAVIALKSKIEKIREQSQNIE